MRTARGCAKARSAPMLACPLGQQAEVEAMGFRAWVGTEIISRTARVGMVLAGACLTFGCGDDDEFVAPTDVAGLYELTLHNGANGCGLEDWVEGNTTTNVGLRIEQQGTDLIGRLEGPVGGIVAVLLGTAELSGSQSRGDVTLQAFSPYVRQQGTCTYNLLVTLQGTLDGNLMSGTIDYTWATNGAPECSDLEGCVTEQTFDAVRTSTEPADPQR